MKFTPSNYRRKEWRQFRADCLHLAHHECERCGKTDQVATLQVHHPHYEAGKMPWEYEHKFCEVLCKGCHAREHGKLIPLSGWELVHSDWESGQSSGPTRCDLCDAAMEWHNDLWHPEWGMVTVGYECAEKLGAPEVHEIKRRRERMNTFVFSPRWKQTLKGWKYQHGDRVVFAMQKASGWVLNIAGVWGGITYPTITAAKERAFLCISQPPRCQGNV